eukprot:TRINITY_DN962_c0_g1_i1.p1 TRINITY_DN962_c0_g1~~TRINITY_DN962_c0_g1_i1.p1  ORF type:complete len:429 (-),score=107.22 TRINITY_DN962_c0_g1_i1:84-1370(-)
MAQESNSYSDIKAQLKLKAEDIIKQYRGLSEQQIALALTVPDLSVAILSVIAKFNDQQLKAAARVMTREQIRVAIPKLQLQQTGVAVQVMSPEQIKHTVASLTTDDRNILMQNISLLSASANKDELQSFIGFVDPLALALAARISELAERIAEACGVMTTEQIRVVVPLISAKHCRKILTALEHESQIEVAVSMIDRSQRDEIVKLMEADIAQLNKKREELSPRLDFIKQQIPMIGRRIADLSEIADKEGEYELIVRNIRSTKSEIENLLQTVQELQATLKLPAKIMNSSDHGEIMKKYADLSDFIRDIGRETHAQSGILSANDGLITVLNSQWERIRPTREHSALNVGAARPANSPISEDSEMFVDDDLAVVLYEAVKKIGNPEAVGSHYAMTWTDIIQRGFRNADDFSKKGIFNLEQLQRYVETTK